MEPTVCRRCGQRRRVGIRPPLVLSERELNDKKCLSSPHHISLAFSLLCPPVQAAGGHARGGRDDNGSATAWTQHEVLLHPSASHGPEL